MHFFNMDKFEYRSAIKFLVIYELTPKEIHLKFTGTLILPFLTLKTFGPFSKMAPKTATNLEKEAIPCRALGDSR